jgi:hypothetical protein
MHTLVVQDSSLYVLLTGDGPARRADWSKALEEQRLHGKTLESLAISSQLKSYMRAVLARQELIAKLNLDDLARGRGCFRFTKADVSNVKYIVTPVHLRLTFKAKGRRFKFDCGLEDKLLVQEFVATLLDKGDGFAHQ